MVFGISVAGISDLTGDGAGEVLVGASGEDIPSFADAGRVYVLNGVTGEVVYVLESPTPNVDGFFGFQTTSLADLNNDGVPEIAAGGHAEPANDLTAAGQLHVFDGATGAPLYSIQSPEPAENGLFGIWMTGTD